MATRIKVTQCTPGVYLRWYFNGYHYYNFQNHYEILMQAGSKDEQVNSVFSRISKSVLPTKIKEQYSYQIVEEGISEEDSAGFRSLLLSEDICMYINDYWYSIELKLGTFAFKESDSPGYELSFVIVRDTPLSEPSEIFTELFNSTVAYINSKWTNSEGSGELEIVADSECRGGYCLKVGNNAGNDSAWLTLNESFLYNPNRLYKIEARVKRTAGAGTFYIGVAGRNTDDTEWYNSDGNNNYWLMYYSAASGHYPVDTDWVTYSGYFTGRGSDWLAHQDITNPGNIVDGVVRIVPLFLANQNAGGVMYIDYLEFSYAENELAFLLDSSPITKAKNVKLYIGDTLCDMEEDEDVPITKQVNDIAEMQDRQTDFTQSFRVRRTNAMRELFEMAGEPGANPTFPYVKQECTLITNEVEIITDGILIVNSKIGDYYNVSVYSGNANFFDEIKDITINDLALLGTAHTWHRFYITGSQNHDYDYRFLTCVPNDDGGVTDDGSTIKFYGGWMWPSVNLYVIWKEIFEDAGFIPKGRCEDIDNDFTILMKKLWMPITSLAGTKADISQYYYSLTHDFLYPTASGKLPGGDVIVGDASFAAGTYVTHLAGKYKYRIITQTNGAATFDFYLYQSGINVGTFAINTELGYQVPDTNIYFTYYEIEYTSASGVLMTFYIEPYGYVNQYALSIVSITDVSIGYASVIASLNMYLPKITQTEFVKMICNLFGFIPETNGMDKVVWFWNYIDLYNNMGQARDWSSYLSVEDDTTEFVTGEYGQNNYLKFNEIDDVVEGTGDGVFQVVNENLTKDKDMVELPVSLCDEVTVLTDKNIGRIAFNKYDGSTDTYVPESTIDPRILYNRTIAGKTMLVYDGYTLTVPSGDFSTKSTPLECAAAVEISFASLISNYTGLSRLLTGTTVKKLKFNLPPAEVANLKHYIPIYLSQHNAYYCVNKILNYVSGKLCVVELIKL